MSTLDAVFTWLASTAAVCLVVLVVGTALAYSWSRPIERLRSIQATFVALVIACLLQSFHVLPQVSLGLLPAPAEVAGREEVAGSSSQRAMDPTEMQRAGRRQDSTQGSHQPVESAGHSAVATDVPDAIPERDGLNALSLVASARAAFVVILLAVSGVVLLKLGLGIVRLRRLVSRSQPVAPEIGQLLQGIQEPHARRVSVLTSADINVPLTFGLRRPVILLPESLVATESATTLRYYLAHEWAHVRNYDIAGWWALEALQPLLWFQPFYWVLRRELRVCQDQLADQFAANLGSDPAPYAQLLVELAKLRRLRQIGIALTMSAGRSALHRRIHALLSTQRHLASVCRPRVFLTSAVVLALLSVVLGVLNLGGARAQVADQPADQPAAPAGDQAAEKPAAEQAKTFGIDGGSAPVEEQVDGSLSCQGNLVDGSTGQPLENAKVTVRRLITTQFERRVLGESKGTTDKLGKYTFVIPKQQLVERFLTIEVEADHPDYLLGNASWQWAKVSQFLKIGRTPPFARLELEPAEALSGRVLDPSEKPLAGATILAYSKAAPRKPNDWGYAAEFRTRSADDGSFRLKLCKKGYSVFWVLPDDYAPRQIVSGEKRGAWGDVRLEEGVQLSGRVVNVEGQPVSGVWVNVMDSQARAELKIPTEAPSVKPDTDDVTGSFVPDFDAEVTGPFSDATLIPGDTALKRSALTDKDGRFKLAPLRPGQYPLGIATQPIDLRYHPRDYGPATLPAAFLQQTVSLGKDSKPLLIRAVPHVRLVGRYCNSQGTNLHDHLLLGVNGKLNGQPYFVSLYSDSEGRIQGVLPRGLEEAGLSALNNDVYVGEASVLRIRVGQDQPLSLSPFVALGKPPSKIEADVTGVEIVRYATAAVLVKAVDEHGKPVPAVTLTGFFQGAPQTFTTEGVGIEPILSFNKAPDGRFSTEQALPGVATRFVASAKGYQDAEITITLAEGEKKELTLVLKRSPGANDAKPEKPAPDSQNKERRTDKPATAEEKRDDDRIDLEGTDGSSEKKPQPAANTHPITVVGTALDSQGAPIQGATIFLACDSPEMTVGKTETDAKGHYEFRDAQLPLRPKESHFWAQGSFQVFGKAKGHAFAWAGRKYLYVDPRFSEQTVLGLSKEDGFFPGEKIELNLTFGPPKRVQGHFIDENGKPIPGVKIQLLNCDYLNTAASPRPASHREFSLINQADTLMPEEVLATSDKEGRFEFKSVPPDVVCRLLIKRPGEENASSSLMLFTATAENPPAEYDRASYDRGHEIVKQPLEMTLHSLRAVPVRVTLGETDQPAAGVQVSARQKQASGNFAYGLTDKNGRFDLKLPPATYKLMVDPAKDTGDYIRTQQDLVVEEGPTNQLVTFRLKPGCVLIFKAVDAETGLGIPGVAFWEMDAQGSRGGVYSNTWLVDYPETNKEGELRTVVEPGTRRYGIGLRKPLPEGYQVIDKSDQDTGRELVLPASRTVTAEFKLRKLKN